MWSAIASVLLGVAGWFVASFFAKPLLDFLNLKSQVHEEIVFTANVGVMRAGTAEYDKAVDSIRRLGAKVQATKVSASLPLGWFLSIFGYDLAKAGGSLIGLSNSLASTDGSRALHTNSIQAGLKLPRDYTDDYLRHVIEQISGRPKSA
jgi:hypothetical protein